jgi:hypothetical protein
MAGLARGLIGFGAILRNGRGRQGRGGALDLERGVVLASDGNARDRLQALFHAFHVTRIGGDLGRLPRGTDVPRKCEKADGHGKQNAENETEIVEEMGVLFAHGREVYL